MQDCKTIEPLFLMCPPDYYSISGPDKNGIYANKFAEVNHLEYSKNPESFLKAAHRQWTDYRDTLNKVGAKTVELEPVHGISDMVFTADPTLSMVLCNDNQAVTISSRFSFTERQVEVDQSVNFIKNFDPERKIIASEFFSEGTGDNYYDPFRDIFWCGYAKNPCRQNASAGRSDIRSHQKLQDVTGVPTISMAVKEPFFHVDTCMAPLSKGHIIVYKGGMEPSAYETLIREGFQRFGMDPKEYLIQVDDEDAKRYACNMRNIDDTIIMPQVSDDLQATLKAKGYDVITLDVSCFINDGGAMHCLTNNLNEKRIPGGNAVRYGFEHQEILEEI